MWKALLVRLVIGFIVVCTVGRFTVETSAAPADRRAVLAAITRGKAFLVGAQQSDGSWDVSVRKESQAIAFTSFTLMALLNSGMSIEDPAVAKGLAWLRDPQRKPQRTHEISLMIEALAAAKDREQDGERIAGLVRQLQTNQARGANDGSWSFGLNGAEGGDDPNSALFAVLALREAQEMGIAIEHSVWHKAREHWITRQNPDGGWGAGRSSGGITAAGIAYVAVTSAALRSTQPDEDEQGRPLCCGDSFQDDVVARGCRWLGHNFAVGHNPKKGGTGWLYYLYGLERVGRLTGRRFLDNARGERHDWYREGADVLVARQDRLTGSWTGTPEVLEDDPVLATSYALMFLSKGLSPVLINALQVRTDSEGATRFEAEGPPPADDVQNLVQHIASLNRWPRQLSCQQVPLTNATLEDLRQAPICYLQGADSPRLSEAEIDRLREYLQHGGVLFASCGCGSAAFDEGFRDLVRRLQLSTDAPLRRLERGHPVFRSEYPLLDRETGNPLVELWGADAGCRTCIFYCPEDLSCFWEKWSAYPRPRRSPEMKAKIDRALRVGINVVAYVTGREPVDKLALAESLPATNAEGPRQRDVLQLARVRHGGDWDAAPDALRHLQVALETTAGVPIARGVKTVSLEDRDLFQYPIVTMHGRNHFTLSPLEQETLRKYLQQGGFLLVDACCGSAAFDHSFRRLMDDLLPEHRLTAIPMRSELFSKRVAFDLTKVQIRQRPQDELADFEIQSVAPALEGVEIDGRLVVVYSRHDLSCALATRAPLACPGYTPESAVQIAVNAVLFALRQ